LYQRNYATHFFNSYRSDGRGWPDGQRSSTSTIHYGEHVRASYNKQFAEMTVTGIPPKPAGEAKIKYHFTIDIYGNLKMEKFSLDNGRRFIISKKITGLLEEIQD
jgi:molecular chaperone DnaK (HSP70)